MFMNAFLSNIVSGKSGANRKRPVSASLSIDLDVFPGPYILGILEHHPERETGLLSFLNV